MIILFHCKDWDLLINFNRPFFRFLFCTTEEVRTFGHNKRLTTWLKIVVILLNDFSRRRKKVITWMPSVLLHIYRSDYSFHCVSEFERIWLSVKIVIIYFLTYVAIFHDLYFPNSSHLSTYAFTCRRPCLLNDTFAAEFLCLMTFLQTSLSLSLRKSLDAMLYVC